MRIGFQLAAILSYSEFPIPWGQKKKKNLSNMKTFTALLMEQNTVMCKNSMHRTNV